MAKLEKRVRVLEAEVKALKKKSGDISAVPNTELVEETKEEEQEEFCTIV